MGNDKKVREGALVGGTLIDKSSSHIGAYVTTMKPLGFEHGGNGFNLDDFEHPLCLAFQLTADLLVDDGTTRPELTGARLGLEFKYATVTSKPIQLIGLGKRRFVVFIDRNNEVVRNSITGNG